MEKHGECNVCMQNKVLNKNCQCSCDLCHTCYARLKKCPMCRKDHVKTRNNKRCDGCMNLTKTRTFCQCVCELCSTCFENLNDCPLCDRRYRKIIKTMIPIVKGFNIMTEEFLTTYYEGEACNRVTTKCRFYNLQDV